MKTDLISSLIGGAGSFAVVYTIFYLIKSIHKKKKEKQRLQYEQQLTREESNKVNE